MLPKNLTKLEGKNAAAMLRLSEALEEHDDVQNVYSNFDVDEKELEAWRRSHAHSRHCMRILGIDCGTEHTGYGLIDSDGRSHRMIAAGSIHTSPKQPLETRLLAIAQGLRQVIQAHLPESAAVEAGLLRPERQNRPEAVARPWRGAAHHSGSWTLGGRILAARDQDQRSRLRTRRKTTGEIDGALLARA